MWSKDILLTNSNQALNLQDNHPFPLAAQDRHKFHSIKNIKAMHDALKASNGRIQGQFVDVKKTRQNKLDIDNWVSDFNAADESYNQMKIKRPDVDPSSQIIHSMANNFRNDKSIVSHITSIQTEQEKMNSMSSTLGVNYILRARHIEEENVKEAESRRAGAGQKDIEKQNELFPNNLEFRMKQKLTSHRPKVEKEEKTLDEKLLVDNQAL